MAQNPAPDSGVFHVDIRPRCFATEGPDGFVVCGELAAWLRPSASGIPDGYYCDRHKVSGDEPIPDSYVITRVTLRLEVVFSGTSWRPGVAKAEALERARAAVERAGGVLNILQLSHQFGRYTPPPARREAIGDRSGG